MKTLKIALIAAAAIAFGYVLADLWLNRERCDLNPFTADRIGCPKF